MKSNCCFDAEPKEIVAQNCKLHTKALSWPKSFVWTRLWALPCWWEEGPEDLFFKKSAMARVSCSRKEKKKNKSNALRAESGGGEAGGISGERAKLQERRIGL